MGGWEFGLLKYILVEGWWNTKKKHKSLIKECLQGRRGSAATRNGGGARLHPDQRGQRQHPPRPRHDLWPAEQDNMRRCLPGEWFDLVLTRFSGGCFFVQPLLRAEPCPSKLGKSTGPCRRQGGGLIIARRDFIFFPKGGGGWGVDGHVHRPLDRVHVAGEEGVLGTGLSLPLQMPRMLVSKWIISYIMYYHKMTTLMAVQFIIANPLLSNGWEPPEDSNEDSWSSELSERSPSLHLIGF